MSHDSQHTLTTAVVSAPHGLRLAFADGKTFDADLAPVIRQYPALTVLDDPALFARARLDPRGGYVIWIEDEIELAADNLRNLAVEQSGAIDHERVFEWMHRNHLTQERAAEAIGITRRMLNYYLSGARPIPKTVWLACVGWESEQREARRSQAGSSAQAA